MKRVALLIVILFFVIINVGCTDNMRAKNFGGSMKENLPVNMKLLNATWKQGDLWLLIKPMAPTDTPETYTFIESSAFGIMNGSVVIIESKNRF